MVNIFLASYSYFEGGAIGNMLYQWEQAGFFSYVLPFLLIFALIFGILSRLRIFTRKEEGKPNNAINAILAFVVALMSLQFDFVPQFFSEVFPRLGVGLVVVLLAIILLSLFLPKKEWADYIFFGIGALIFLIILNKSFGILSWTSGALSSETVNLIIILVVVLAFIGIIIGVSSRKEDKGPTSRFFREIHGK